MLRGTFGGWFGLVWLVAILGGLTLGLAAMRWYWPRTADDPPMSALTLVYIFIGIGCGAGAAAGYWVVRRVMHRSLRRQLNDAGQPTCMKCGYDLRGQTEARCPECGEPLDRGENAA